VNRHRSVSTPMLNGSPVTARIGVGTPHNDIAVGSRAITIDTLAELLGKAVMAWRFALRRQRGRHIETRGRIGADLPAVGYFTTQV
jgi:hypothetical protein